MIDTMKERELNLKDIPELEHITGEIYSFKGVKIDMNGCGAQHMQMYRHIAVKLAEQIRGESKLKLVTLQEFSWPKTDKVKAYQRLRLANKRVIQLAKEPLFKKTVYRSMWQTPYGKKCSKFRLLPFLLDNPHYSLATISEAEFARLEEHVIASSWKLDFFKDIQY